MTDRFTTPFGAQSTAADVIAGVDLTGKRAIVTGGAAGLGVETARALAERRRRGHPRRPRPRRREVAAACGSRDRQRRVDVGRSIWPIAARSRASWPRLGRSASTSWSTTPGSWRPLMRTPRGLGAAVRHQPPRPLRADRRACTTRSPPPAMHAWSWSAPSVTSTARSASTTSTSPGSPTTRGWPTRSPRPRTSCSRSRRPSAGQRTGSVNALNPGRIWGTGLSRHMDAPPHLVRPEGKHRRLGKDDRARGCDLRAAGRLATRRGRHRSATSRIAGRRCRSPRACAAAWPTTPSTRRRPNGSGPSRPT